MKTSTEMTSTAADLQAELQYLRERNADLQSQVECLLRCQREAGKSHMECGENSTASAPSHDAGLGHRKADEKKEPPVKGDRSGLPSGLHHRHSTRVDGHSGSSAASKRRSDPGSHLVLVTSSASGSSVEVGLENEHNKDKILRGRLKKKSSCGTSNGQYFHEPSMDRGDEEGGRLPDVPMVVSQDPNDDDITDEELENLIDDDSHNKHLPKIAIPGSTQSDSRSSPTSAAFPPFKDQLKERAGWLIGLLVLQSCSSFIIQRNQRFLQKHMVIVQFLTMLVGAGGNAGNQAAVRVIRALAVGTLNQRTMERFLRNEAKMALSLSVLIGMTGFARAAVFRVPPGETIAVTASVCAIVAISVAIGNALPLGMKRVGIDPAHSSTTIQVVMDILGVLITVCVSSFVLSFKVFHY